MRPRRRIYPRWTPRLAADESLAAIKLWPHAVAVSNQRVRICWDRPADVLDRDGYVWLRRNATGGHLRFMVSASPEPLAYRIRFMDPDEAFAFKMRWG